MSYKRFLRVFSNRDIKGEYTGAIIRLPVKLDINEAQKFSVIIGLEIDKFLRLVLDKKDEKSSND